jgi:hypothetical protein
MHLKKPQKVTLPQFHQSFSDSSNFSDFSPLPRLQSRQEPQGFHRKILENDLLY